MGSVLYIERNSKGRVVNEELLKIESRESFDRETFGVNGLLYLLVNSVEISSFTDLKYGKYEAIFCATFSVMDPEPPVSIKSEIRSFKETPKVFSISFNKA